jgi:electron transfer flavoprotein beta subunit
VVLILANVKMSMNPFDEIAVEEAIRLKEKGVATEIVAVMRPGEGAGDASHGAGDGRGPRSDRERREVEPLAVAKLLAKVAAEETPGHGDPGNRRSTTIQARCSRRCWAGAQGTFASKVEVSGDAVAVTREVDGGLETVNLKLPAIVTTDLRLNEPRYASLPNIMKAKSKPLAQKNARPITASTSRRASRPSRSRNRRSAARASRWPMSMSWLRSSKRWE